MTDSALVQIKPCGYRAGVKCNHILLTPRGGIASNNDCVGEQECLIYIDAYGEDKTLVAVKENITRLTEIVERLAER